MIIPLKNGAGILQAGAVSCQCCPGPQELDDFVIRYNTFIVRDPFSGLPIYYKAKTKTLFLGQASGPGCATPNLGSYVKWREADPPNIHQQFVNVRLEAARAAGLWTSSVNIDLFLNVPPEAADLVAEYAGISVINPAGYSILLGLTDCRFSATCADRKIGTIIVDANRNYQYVSAL
jgi:hypothetical protein